MIWHPDSEQFKITGLGNCCSAYFLTVKLTTNAGGHALWTMEPGLALLVYLKQLVFLSVSRVLAVHHGRDINPIPVLHSLHF